MFLLCNQIYYKRVHDINRLHMQSHSTGLHKQERIDGTSNCSDSNATLHFTSTLNVYSLHFFLKHLNKKLSYRLRCTQFIDLHLT